ncbi:NAD(P)H-binding protein [Brachybacterium hainanense]|uniref:NAD(P)H-binding protein n=1 Tax=Brachybacterium hainanense TaxID=1541174 RepID=A0ABV6R7H2_9MICO
MKIMLIGGHGRIALLAAPLLVQAGHEVGAAIRDPAHSADVEATGARPVLQDVQDLDPAGWDALLRGAEAVVWSAGAGGGNPARTRAIDQEAAIASMDAAQRIGVRRYLMVSYFGASREHGVPQDDPFFAYAEAKAAADAHLRGTGLDWTILAPSALTVEEPSGRIDLGAAAAGSISRGNVARMIVETLARPALAGRFLAANDGEQEIGAALDAVS